MKIIDIENRKFAILNDESADEVNRFIDDNPLVEGLIVSRHDGYKKNSIDHLKEIRNIKILSISDAEDFDLTPVERMVQLEHLSIDGKHKGIDLSGLTSLVSLAIEHSKKTILPESNSRALHNITLYSYKPLDRSLTTMPTYNNLKELTLVKTNVTTLSGIENLNQLDTLNIHYASSLTTIDPLQKLSNLEILLFENCKNIEDWDRLSKLKHLKDLKLGKCGSISNLRFVKTMSSLKYISFVETTIEDGDLSWCLGLQYVGFLPKKGYSHKPEDFVS